MEEPLHQPASTRPRAARSRAALLAATVDIVAREGETAVTTTRVAAAAGLSVGAVYRYFADRDALLLAAYDETVSRIVEACRAVVASLSPDLSAADAARRLLGAYLEAADAEPAHGGLLRAMRRIRPVETDQGANEGLVVGELFAPFVRRYADTAVSPDRFHMLSVLMGTLVDLYLVTEGDAARRRLRLDIEAHMLLALTRLAAELSPEQGGTT